MEHVIIGYGSAGQRHAALLLERKQKIVAIADPIFADTTLELGLDITEYTDADECLEQESEGRAVMVCSPNGFHVPQATKALDNGCGAIFVEKPLGISYQECVDLAEAAEFYGVPNMVGFNWRFHNAVTTYMKHAIEANHIGLFTNYFSENPLEWPSWKNSRYTHDKVFGGILLTSMCHCIDKSFIILGPALRLHSSMTYNQNGVSVTSAIRIQHHKGGESFLVGRWDKAKSHWMGWVTETEAYALDMNMHESNLEKKNMMIRQIDSWLRYIESNESGINATFLQGAAVQGIMHAAEQSAHTGEIVTFVEDKS